MDRPRIALLYVAKDAQHGRRLATDLAPLSREGKFHVWSPDQLDLGRDREAQVEHALASSDIVLPLISPDLLADETSLLRIERLRAEGRARLVPVLVRPADFKSVEALQGLPHLPQNGAFISTWSNEDQGWLEVVHGIRGPTGADATPPPLPARGRRWATRLTVGLTMGALGLLLWPLPPEVSVSVSQDGRSLSFAVLDASFRCLRCRHQLDDDEHRLPRSCRGYRFDASAGVQTVRFFCNGTPYEGSYGGETTLVLRR